MSRMSLSILITERFNIYNKHFIVINVREIKLIFINLN